MIYQKHPEHGRHICYNGLEETQNISNGWKTVTEDEFYNIKPEGKKEPEEDLGLSRDDLIELYVVKFGKKPHHMTKTAKIKAALDE